MKTTVKTICNFILITVISCSNSERQGGITGSSANRDNQETEITYVPGMSLCKAASYPVGVAVSAEKLGDSRYAGVVRREFNSVTAENQMKMAYISVAPGKYDWERADAIVAYAEKNNTRVHGHALLWHESLPPWVENFEGTDEEFEAEIKTYIQAVVEHFKGKVASWDVVNEAIEEDGSWRNTVFLQHMGEDYVARCFRWAREADPGVLLFYNDFNLSSNPVKAQAAADMLKGFQDRGVPVDGVGMQMHIQVETPAISKIADAVNIFTEMGLIVHFSEIDTRLNADDKLTELTYEAALAQENRLGEIVDMYNTIPESQQYGITFWGLRDNESWLLSRYGTDWPLLFTETYEYKIAHRGVIRAFE